MIARRNPRDSGVLIYSLREARLVDLAASGSLSVTYMFMLSNSLARRLSKGIQGIDLAWALGFSVPVGCIFHHSRDFRRSLPHHRR